ncbi:MAG: hypothetical protein RL148_1088 [Planctomycetota bacterium]
MSGSREGAVAGDEVKPLRLLAALLLGVVGYLLAGSMPLPPGKDVGAAQLVLAVTFTTATCWLTGAMPLGAAGVLPMVLLPFLGLRTAREVASSYSDPILLLFGGGFVLALVIERWNLHRRIALGVLRFVGANPSRLVLGFFLAATLISLFINNTSVALMLLPIGTVLIQRTTALGILSPTAARNFGAGVMLAIAYGASIGGIGTPIGTPPNAVFFGAWSELVEKGLAEPVSFFSWTLAFAPVSVVLAVVMAWLFTRFLLPLPRGAMAGAQVLLDEARTLPPMGRAERRVAWIFAGAVLLWATRGDVPLGDGDVLHGWAHHLMPEGRPEAHITDGIVAIAVAVLAFLVPSGEPCGRRLMDWPSMARMPWELLLMLGGGMALAAAFEPVGLSAAFGELMKPWIGAVHPALFLFVLIVATTLFSEVASNVALAALLVPILRDGAMASGLDPRLLMIPATLAASFGFMLPIATPPNAIVFSSGRVSMGQMVRAGLALDVIAAVLLVAVLWFWAFPVLGVDPGAMQGGPR